MPFPLPNPRPSPGDDDGGSDAAVARTAGFVVFSGIAMSIIKALTPKPGEQQSRPTPATLTPPPPPPPPPSGEISKVREPVTKALSGSGSSSARIVEIVRGDTLWGLSRKYGVSIDAIKDANGIEGDKIYAGKKLVIP